MTTHSSILAWRIQWTEEPDRLQSIESQRVGHDWRDLAPPTHVTKNYKTLTNVAKFIKCLLVISLCVCICFSLNLIFYQNADKSLSILRLTRKYLSFSLDWMFVLLLFLFLPHIIGNHIFKKLLEKVYWNFKFLFLDPSCFILDSYLNIIILLF